MIFALYLDGEGSPRVEAFRDVNHAQSAGNGIAALYATEGDIIEGPLRSHDMVRAYNALTGENIKAFHDRQISAKRLLAATQAVLAGAAVTEVSAVNAEAIVDADLATSKIARKAKTEKQIREPKAVKEAKLPKGEASEKGSHSRNVGKWIRASDAVLEHPDGAEAYHRQGSDAYNALVIIIAHGRGGAHFSTLVTEGVSTKYLSRTLRTTNLLIAEERFSEAA